MKNLFICCPDWKESTYLASAARAAVQEKNLRLDPTVIRQISELLRKTEQEEVLDLLTCDVTADAAVPALEQLRGRYPGMKMVLLADSTVPPVMYIRPTILPTALLWRPLHQEDARRVLLEVLAQLQPEEQELSDDTDTFLIDVRGVVRSVPCREILFFESRDKRLYLHQKRKELPFAGTLEKLTEKLPESFVRIHKSFIVNAGLIREIRFGQNELELQDGTVLPISRSYKAALKAVFA